MLTLVEKILFILAAIASIHAGYRVARRFSRIILRGHGKPDLTLARQRMLSALVKIATLQPTFNIRFWPSLFHALIAWGFFYYILINLGDILEAFIPRFNFLGSGAIGSIYRFLGDLLPVGGLLGMVAMLARRFILKTSELSARHIFRPQTLWRQLLFGFFAPLAILFHSRFNHAVQVIVRQTQVVRVALESRADRGLP